MLMELTAFPLPVIPFHICMLDHHRVIVATVSGCLGFIFCNKCEINGREKNTGE